MEKGENMKFLVIGLGSMGKRRLRCLKALGHKEMYGFDLREDRRQEVESKYQVKTFSNIDAAVSEIQPDCFIISVPPDKHHIYMKRALNEGRHFFVEASVTDEDMELVIEKAREKKTVAAPSTTMTFHPAIQQIERLIKSNTLGKISNVLFHSGQYLPDWHTYEKVSDYYVSNPATGGAREIVPFELTWITALLGFPITVSGNVRKTIHIQGAEKIDDTYNILLDYEDFLCTLTVDCVSRYATRRLVINGEKAQLVWSWDANCIQVYHSETKAWEKVEYQMMKAQDGYNANIGENMYIDELNAFIQAVVGKGTYPNTLENDHRVLRVLYAAETSHREGKTVKFERNR